MEEFNALLIIMVVVWVAGKVFRYLKLPVIFGELLGGIIVGPLVLGVVSPDNETIKVLADLGVFFLMLHAGLDADPNDLFKGSRKSIGIALLSVSISFGLVYYVSQLLNFSIRESLFIATALSASAIAISVRLLKELHLHNTSFGHTVISASFLSEILILIIFSIVESGSVNYQALLFLLGKIIIFFGIVILFGFKFQKYFSKFFQNKGFTLTLIIALAMGFLAEMMGLHVILGAFLAGLFIREELIGGEIFDKIEDRIYGLSYSFLGPIFFTSLAFSISFKELPEKSLLIFTTLLITSYLATLVGAGSAAYSQKVSMKKSALIGVAMNNKGIIDLVIISIGLQNGIIEPKYFSILILVIFSSTLLSHIILKVTQHQITKAT